MQQGPCLVNIAFIPTTWVTHFVISEEGQDGGKCQFLCKKDIIHLDNELQQAQVDNALKKINSHFKFQ